MLQNGIDLSTVDVSYVSSRSWYSRNSLQQYFLEHQLIIAASGLFVIINDVYNDYGLLWQVFPQSIWAKGPL